MRGQSKNETSEVPTTIKVSKNGTPPVTVRQLFQNYSYDPYRFIPELLTVLVNNGTLDGKDLKQILNLKSDVEIVD